MQIVGTQTRTLYFYFMRYLISVYLVIQKKVCMIVFKVAVVVLAVSMFGIVAYDTISKIIR